MRLIHRPMRAGAIAVLGLAMTAVTGALASSALAAAPAAPAAPAGSPRSPVQPSIALPRSLTATHAASTGAYSSPRMSVEVALEPAHQAELNALMRALYAKGSGSYHHWLAKGQFYASFAPTSSARAAVVRYLTREGLTVVRSASPFLVRAVGSSKHVSAAFGTTLTDYRNSRGQRFYANSAAVHLPGALAGGVYGVIGLTNMVREHDLVVRPKPVAAPRGQHVRSVSCETGFPTDAQLEALYVDGQSLASGYGAGPGCSGLTPTQTNSIYSAPNAGAAAKGAGQTLAVFELSAYQKSDIATWARTFYGHSFSPPLANVNVDGGPLNPRCPAGDTCPSSSQGYAGDIEVDADIETQLTISPDASRIIVYNAPNDETGQTTLDEYTRIADDDSASAVSSSWGECENDLGSALAQAENVVFEQMAAQGQSMFASAGDDGAFDCLDTDGTSVVNVDDPEAQPWVTSVGGTSFENFNPDATVRPSYPAGNVETVWNPGGLCNTSPSENGATGLFWCDNTGAGGGGSSQFWGRPTYQRGPGVNNPDTTYANGTTHCALAKAGTTCREVPDISANADEWTPYAEYCTGNASTPNSVCATFSGSQPVPGWFGIGGTSLSSPLWSGIAADLDGYSGGRAGNLNPLLYSLLDGANPGRYFHDITGIGPNQALADNNGLFPATPNYDEATGIGTPIMAALITGR
jgi:subtilase family serine protease